MNFLFELLCILNSGQPLASKFVLKDGQSATVEKCAPDSGCQDSGYQE